MIVPGIFGELKNAVQAVDTIRKWREETIAKAETEEEARATEVLADATILVEMMNEYANGYRRLCGQLQDFGPYWSEERRREAEAAYRAWIDEQVFAPEISKSLSSLRTAADRNETVAELVESGQYFLSNSVYPLLNAKNRSAARGPFIRALLESKTEQGGEIVRRWALQTLRRLNRSQDQLNSANEIVGRLRGELRILNLPVMSSPVHNEDRPDVPNASWRSRVASSLRNWAHRFRKTR